ncbi:hypothetical protein EDC96DRAFT_545322 [Choanephora cucurbitarum]|nr:hypothetical protein EDC96DRAFT_545322 [Choanephora cucurbitarum]
MRQFALITLALVVCLVNSTYAQDNTNPNADFNAIFEENSGGSSKSSSESPTNLLSDTSKINRAVSEAGPLIRDDVRRRRRHRSRRRGGSDGGSSGGLGSSLGSGSGSGSGGLAGSFNYGLSA